VGSDRLSRATVAEHALKLADSEGLGSVTIRRLAQELGVTPMALYWHFKNKDELYLGMVDHALARVKATREKSDPWLHQLRSMVEALIATMREHPSLTELLQQEVDMHDSTSLARATSDALELLTRGGYGLEDGYWAAAYLLHGSIGLVSSQPGCPSTMTPAEAEEWRRQKRLTLEMLPRDEYPMLVAFARTLESEPDVERYYRFGVDLLMAGIASAKP
jgi:AcrR family transcriptional regulator